MKNKEKHIEKMRVLKFIYINFLLANIYSFLLTLFYLFFEYKYINKGGIKIKKNIPKKVYIT